MMSQSGPMGAESSYYEGLDPGYMAANTKFHRIEELKASERL